jgi:uncharacterized protein YggE
MRWVIIAMAATMFVADANVLAAETSTALSTNEIAIEMASTGVAVLPADKATVVLTLRKTGATNREARASVRAFADQLTSELVALGLSKASIDFEEPTNRLGFVGNEAVTEMMESMGQVSPPPKRPVSASASLEITISDLAFLPKLRDFIDRKDAVVMENPSYSLSDDRRARNAAINDAISKARLDADAYAAALGMRVDRVIGAKDQAAQSNFFFPDYEKMFERFGGQSEIKSGMVKTSARVIVEFALTRR